MEISNVETYIEAMGEFTERTTIFRGISKPEQRVPTVVRSFCSSSKIDHGCGDFRDFQSWYRSWCDDRTKSIVQTFKNYERTIFESFIRQSRIFLPSAPANKWEWLAAAQHFGLRTRLLDWSKNPLVALYFSVSGRCSGDSQVVACSFGELATGPDSMISADSLPCKDPLEYKGPLERFIPPIIDGRMSAQQSVFTVQSDPFELVTGPETTEFTVVAEHRATIRKQLHRLGINQASLFPDINGLCENLTWVWEQYRGA